MRKQIPGFSKFLVTRDGQVFNMNGRRLKSFDCHGYRRISLTKDDGRRVGVDVHRLVASTWIGPIPKGYWVNHEDGNKANNHVSNLKIDTPSYNHRHAFAVLGRKAGNANPARIEAVTLLHSLGWSNNKIANALGCSSPNVSQILTRAKN